jgi:hypothetical protein
MHNHLEAVENYPNQKGVDIELERGKDEEKMRNTMVPYYCWLQFIIIFKK